MSRRRPARTIGGLGEFGFLSRVISALRTEPGAIVGPGQDCAVIRSGTSRSLLTVDALVEGVHFHRSWLSPRQLGRKSFLVNASDIAAMGGRPRSCVVSLAVPPTYRARDLHELQRGIVEAARRCGAAVVGGNLTRAFQLSVSITLLGDAPRRVVTRQGARVGDHVYVTGTLGDAALAVRCLRAARTVPASVLRRFREPTPQLQAGRLLVESGLVSAMIDVSDGLVQDLGHICTESRVGAIIDGTRVPVSRAYRTALGQSDPLALYGGEDYELLCTVPERNVKRLERRRAQLGCVITCIGRIAAGGAVHVVDAAGRQVALGAAGFDHFRSGSRR